MVGVRAGPAPNIDARAFLASLYTVFLWVFGLAVSPEAQQRLAARLGGEGGGRRRKPGRAWLRMAPIPGVVRRWRMLQTLPIDARTFERSFLVPNAVALLAVSVLVGLFVAGVLSFARFNATVAVFAACTIWIFAGGGLVATHSGRRFARTPDRFLQGMHAVGAAMWMGAPLLLSIVGGFAMVFFDNRFGNNAPPDLVFAATVGGALWIVGLFLLPGYAYFSARERLVATARPFEGNRRPLFLLGGGVAFVFGPLALLWITFAT